MSFTTPPPTVLTPQKMKRADSNEFKPPLLNGPSKQIRLLRIGPNSTDDQIVCWMIVVDVDNAPPYGAISYTWGSPKKVRIVQINGEEVPVGQNCYYALWQARHHTFYDYHWIDALCIDQANLVEKSSQVQMMGDIFKRAACVLVCVGPHADGSNELFDTFNKLNLTFLQPVRLGTMKRQMQDNVLGFLADAIRGLRCSRGDVVSALRCFASWTVLLKPDDSRLDDPRRLFEDFIAHYAAVLPWPAGASLQAALISLYRMLQAFMKRPYWYRVWIVQEICLASQARILCGTSSFQWKDFAMFNTELSRLSDLASDGRHVYPQGVSKILRARTILEANLSPMSNISFFHGNFTSPPSASLELCLDNFKLSKCSNPLDHVYGFLGLIAQPEHIHQKITADYQKTTLQLALSALDIRSTCDLKSTRLLCAALELQDSPAMQQWIYDRRRRFRRHLAADQISPYLCIEADRHSEILAGDERPEPQRRDLVGCGQILQWHIVTTIRIDETGSLTTNESFKCDYQGCNGPPECSFVEKIAICESLQALRSTARPRIVWIDSKALALVCSQTQTGDILISHRDLGISKVPKCEGFIVRYHKKDLYQIIGHAIMNPEYRLRPSMPLSKDPLTHSSAYIRSCDLRKDIDRVFDLYFDKQDWLAYASSLLEDDEYTKWPARLSTSVTRQKFSSFAVIRNHHRGTLIMEPAILRDLPGQRYASCSSSEIERGETSSGPLRELSTRPDGIRRVASCHGFGVLAHKPRGPRPLPARKLSPASRERVSHQWQLVRAA